MAQYTVRAWPTLVLIDPAGYVVAAVAGEGHTAELDQVIAAVIRTIAGTGTAGLADGPLDRARFDEPGGLSLAGRTLYVADTNNHAVRAVDLDAGLVRTVSQTHPASGLP